MAVLIRYLENLSWNSLYRFTTSRFFKDGYSDDFLCNVFCNTSYMIVLSDKFFIIYSIMLLSHTCLVPLRALIIEIKFASEIFMEKRLSTHVYRHAQIVLNCSRITYLMFEYSLYMYLGVCFHFHRGGLRTSNVLHLEGNGRVSRQAECRGPKRVYTDSGGAGARYERSGGGEERRAQRRSRRRR